MNWDQARNAAGWNCLPTRAECTGSAVMLGICGFLLGGLILVPSVFGRNPDPIEGRKVFSIKGCARCHTVLGEGGSIGPDLSRLPSAGDGLDLAAAMWSHGPRMWQRMATEQVRPPKFEGEEMEDLFAFLTMASSLDEPGNAEAGRLVFQNKRRCVECHSVQGKGGKVGPDLARVARNRNPVAWIAGMWNHAPGMFRAMTEKGVPFPRFEGSEMADLQAYIRLTAGLSGDRIYYRYVRPPSSDEGETVFRVKQCVLCHSLGGYGGKVGPDLSRAALPRKYGAIALLMWNHAPQMQRMMAVLSIPPPRFEAQELADLLAYLSSLSMKREGDAAAGRRTFAAKGCSGCHSTTVGTTNIGPNLTGLQGNLTPINIARAMWNHGPAMLQRMEKSAITWPVFNSKELSDTLAFLKSIKSPSSQSAPAKAAASAP